MGLIFAIRYVANPNISFNVLKLANSCRDLDREACISSNICSYYPSKTKKCSDLSSNACKNESSCEYIPPRQKEESCSGLGRSSCYGKSNKGCTWNEKKTKKVCKDWRTRSVSKDCTSQDCKNNKHGCEFTGISNCSNPKFADQLTCEFNGYDWIYSKDCSGKYKV